MTTPSDMYMNFMDLTATYNATNSSTLVESEVATGLSIRGGLAFLIHMFEIIFPTHDNNTVTHHASISSKAGESTRPSLGDQGCLTEFQANVWFATQGGSVDFGKEKHFLPPIPYANPKIVAYIQTDADVATLRSDDVKIRIGYTTAKIDAKMYTELAETWGFAN